MSDAYVGLIVLEIDGVEYDVKRFEETVNTNRKTIKTMNRTGRSRGHAKGVVDYTISCSVAIPKRGEPNWVSMVDAKISLEPQDGGGKRETFTGVFLQTMGSKYDVDGEAVRDLTLGALDRYEE
ncbi:hypothetical protein [Luteibacter yeojuensis]|uniref:Phage tail protein n=1 Tax=Luteibacter yeojuensis TaxID=345309 RepID=A0A0F3KFS9_9GAMM|nr:hypothetical protein [Luteibacter yeojuensis]KJV30026.1 phage tail protein [Luteibacter yeojuensis]